LNEVPSGGVDESPGAGGEKIDNMAAPIGVISFLHDEKITEPASNQFRTGSNPHRVKRPIVGPV
jgi:hypothetical protein